MTFPRSTPAKVTSRRLHLAGAGRMGLSIITIITLGFSLAGQAQAQEHCTAVSPCVTAVTNLGTLGGSTSIARSVSADGSVVVGDSLIVGDLVTLGFRWTPTGMVSLGTLGGTNAFGLDVSSDGSVVVGNSQLAGDVASHAFRSDLLGLLDLGTLGGLNSFALGVNADGSVVVGNSQITGNTANHAFRWTSAGGIVDLGTLGGTDSSALDVSADGSVVVGNSQIAGDAASRAFRWTPVTAMVDLGTLGGTNSNAIAVNGDGAVVVGNSDIAGNTASHAFRWTSAGMADLGTLGGTNSTAYGVSADGSVIVGHAQTIGDAAQHAFRWTAATAMQDLNTLLANAGVDMTGITLTSARGISGNGQFIVGQGDFPSLVDQAFIVRYFDGIAGVATLDGVQSSVNNVSAARAGTLAQQHGLVHPLLGGDKPMGLGSETGAFVSGGSASAGGTVRYSWGNGLSVLGGLAYAQEDYPDAELKHGTTGALALQYIHGAGGWMRPFVEAGGWYAPNAGLKFERSYANGAGIATGVGSTSGDLSYIYARFGVLFAQDRNVQVALSTEYGQSRLATDAYVEPLTPTNPFEAHVSSATDTIDVAKVRLAWSQQLGPRWDATVWVAGVRGFNRDTDVVATVPGFGALMPASLDTVAWAEYGARLGYKLTEAMTLDTFVNGVSGSSRMGTRVHTGTGLRVQF